MSKERSEGKAPRSNTHSASLASLPKASGPAYSLGFSNRGGVPTCLPPRRVTALINACIMLWRWNYLERRGRKTNKIRSSLLDYVWDPSGCLEKAANHSSLFPLNLTNQIFPKGCWMLSSSLTFFPPQRSLKVTVPLGLCTSSWVANNTAQH